MTFLGLGLIVIGFIGLLAGLISLALVRYGSQIVRRYSSITHGRAAVVAAAAAPLMVLGFILSDPRRMMDLVGMALLAVSLVAVVVVFSLPVAARVRGNGSTIRAIISGAAAVLTIGSFIGVAIMVGGDLQSLLILFGFFPARGLSGRVFRSVLACGSADTTTRAGRRCGVRLVSSLLDGLRSRRNSDSCPAAAIGA